MASYSSLTWRALLRCAASPLSSDLATSFDFAPWIWSFTGGCFSRRLMHRTPCDYLSEVILREARQRNDELGSITTVTRTNALWLYSYR